MKLVMIILFSAGPAFASLSVYKEQSAVDLGPQNNRICLLDNSSRVGACSAYIKDKQMPKYADIISDLKYFSAQDEGIQVAKPDHNFDLMKFSNASKHAFCDAGMHRLQSLQDKVSEIHAHSSALNEDAGNFYGSQHAGPGVPYAPTAPVKGAK